MLPWTIIGWLIIGGFGACVAVLLLLFLWRLGLIIYSANVTPAAGQVWEIGGARYHLCEPGPGSRTFSVKSCGGGGEWTTYYDAHEWRLRVRAHAGVLISR